MLVPGIRRIRRGPHHALFAGQVGAHIVDQVLKDLVRLAPRGHRPVQFIHGLGNLLVASPPAATVRFNSSMAWETFWCSASSLGMNTECSFARLNDGIWPLPTKNIVTRLRSIGAETLYGPRGDHRASASAGCGAGILCLHSALGHCQTGPALSHFSRSEEHTSELQS